MIVIVSTFAVPGILSWRDTAKLRSAAENLKVDLECAKLKAIEENGSVAIHFGDDRYQIFLDDGATPGELDAGEPIYKNVTMPVGVRIDFTRSTFKAVDGAWPRKTSFKGKGTADAGKAVLMNSAGTKAKSVTVSGLGKITMANYKLD